MSSRSSRMSSASGMRAEQTSVQAPQRLLAKGRSGWQARPSSNGLSTAPIGPL